MSYFFKPYHLINPIERLLKAVKPEKTVRHQQTCPVCGRKLVNTYRRQGQWKCRRCWETEEP